jgi:hypothetical protein
MQDARVLIETSRLALERKLRNAFSYDDPEAFFWLHVHSAGATCNSHQTGVRSALNACRLPLRLRDDLFASLNICAASRQLPFSWP